MSLFQQIRECNKGFRAGQGRLLDSSGAPFVVLACIDPRLTGFLEPALGLPRNRALVIRVAGNRVAESTPEVLRSIAAAVYVKGAGELLIVGHTDCAMARFSAQETIESFRRAGVPRNAFGDGDLRSWFGAFADIKANVLASAAHVRRSGLFSKAFKVHGVILGTDDGSLEVVLDGDTAVADALPGSLPYAEPTACEKVAPEKAQDEASVHASPPLPAAPRPQPGLPVIIAVPAAAHAPAAAEPASIASAAMVLRDFFLREKGAHFQETVADLHALVRRERNPARVVPILERIVRDYRARYPELPGALECLKKTLQSDKTSGLQFMEFIRRILD
jgi:carbonic anhydrase